MLLDSKYTIVPQIRFILTYDNGVRKVITVKTRDTIDCSYKKDGERFSTKGVVAKIGCNFNSSLGRVGTTAYLQIDSSSEYGGQVEYIQPSQIIDLNIISTTDVTDNVVCSIDNEDQKITLIRENEIGNFQYSLDGMTWKNLSGGEQGMSAYECAVALGFVGSEEEWLESLKGEPGEPGEAGALEIYKVFNSIDEAEDNRDLIPKGKLVAAISDPDTILLVRNGSSKYGTCLCSCCNRTDSESVKVKGYDFVGYLTVGPQGPKGDPGQNGVDGKSAYQYAIEGGFPGTEAEFMQILSKCSVAVTNYFMGQNPELTNTVIGPIDLRIFGYTNKTTFKSKEISRIDISSPTEIEDQTLIFPGRITLRAVPTDNEASKPNVTINGQKYVADCIMNRDGKVGVFRRVTYIESYSGETIIGDWISSTGELDMGAQVQYISYGKFEPFEETVQAQYKKFHSYDEKTIIQTTDSTYVSVTYPIDIKKFVENYVEEHVDEYLKEKGEEIMTPIATKIVDEKMESKQDRLTAGEHISISSSNVISVSGIGTIPSGKTLIEYIDDSTSTIEDELNDKINGKQNKLTAGKNITINNDEISCDADSSLGEEITTTQTVGGIVSGTILSADTTLSYILKEILCPSVPPTPPAEQCVYYGTTSEIPTTLEGMEKELVDESTLAQTGISHKYTTTKQYLSFAVKKKIGPVVSIRDKNGFEQLEGWAMSEYSDGTNDWYIYHNMETVTISNFKLTFIFIDE